MMVTAQLTLSDRIVERWYQFLKTPEANYKLGVLYEEYKLIKKTMRAYLDAGIGKHPDALQALHRIARDKTEANLYIAIILEKNTSWVQAVESYQKTGTGAAYYRIGLIYSENRYNGTNLEISQNLEEAIGWYHQAAKLYSAGALDALLTLSNNHSLAKYFIGSLCENGVGLPLDKKKALQYYVESDQEGSKDAAYRLGQLEADLLAKYHYYVRASERKHDEANQLIEGLLIELDDEQLSALSPTQLVAAERGKRALGGNKIALNSLIQNAESDCWSSYVLAVMYEKGTGVVRNQITALKYYANAAKQSHSPSLQYLISLSEKGNPEAQTILAADYYMAVDLPEDAAQWAMLAAQQRYEPARSFMRESVFPSEVLFKIAELYEKGIWVKRDLDSAFEYYKKASIQGHSKADFHAGQLVPLIKTEAEEEWDYHLQAANKGIKDSLAPLERMAELGNSSKKIKMAQVYMLPHLLDVKKSLYWLEKAKLFENPLAQPMIDSLMEERICTKKILVMSKSPKQKTTLSSAELPVNQNARVLK